MSKLADNLFAATLISLPVVCVVGYFAWITPVSDINGIPVAVISTTFEHSSKTGRLLMRMEGDLQSGKRVLVHGTPELAPRPGETMKVRQRTNVFGFTRYTIGPMP